MLQYAAMRTCIAAFVQSMAGMESGLTEQQTKAADINGDKTVSVEDAQLILIYYVSNTILEDKLARR